MAIGLGTAVGYLDLDITGFARGIDSATSKMTGLGSQCTTVSGSLTTVGQTLTNVGGVMTASFTAPIVAAGAAAIKTGKDFDASMSQVSAVSKATGEDFEMIRDRAMEMGEKTRYSASEVSDAMYYMGLAGWDAQQIYAGIPGVLALGAASGEDLSRVSDIVTDSLTAFGKSAEDTGEFVNVLAEATRSSNTDVDQLGQAFKYVAPVAGAFGYSIQDVAIMLGTFANAGVKGSQAGTGLRQALNALINPSDKAAAQMEKYGVTLFNADGSTKDLMTVMRELRGTFGGLAIDITDANGEVMDGEAIMEKYGHALPTTEMEKLQAIVQIFGVRALPGMLSVIQAGEDDFNDLATAIYGAQDAYDGLGTAFGMQQTMMDNLQGDWYLFTSALGTTKIIISDLLKNGLRELLQSLTALVNKFNNLDEEQQKNILKWAGIVAAIGPVLMILGKFITTAVTVVQAVQKLGSAFSVIGSALSGVAGDIGAFMSLVGENGLMATITGLTGVTGGMIAAFAAIAAAVIALIAAFKTLWDTSEEFRETMTEIWNGIVDKFREAGKKITDAINSLGFDFENITEALKAAWMGFCDLVAPLFEGAFRAVAAVLEGVIDVVVGVVEILTGIIKGFKDGDWSLLWQGICDVVTGVVNAIVGVLDGVGEAIWGMVQVVANWFGADWHMTWDEAKQAVVDFVKGAIDWIGQLPGKIASFFSNIWNNITTWVSNMVNKAIELGKNFVEGVVTWFQQLPGKIAGFISDVWNSITSWVTDMVNKAAELGKNFVNSIVDWFKQLPTKISEFVSSIWQSITQWVSNMLQKAHELGEQFLNTVTTFFQELPYKVGYFIGYTLTSVGVWVANMIQKAYEMGRDFINNVVQFFTELPGKVKQFLDSAWNNVTQWATNMVNKAKEMAQNFLSNVVSFFQQLPGKVKEFIDSAWNNVTQWATNMINKAKEVGQNFLNSITSFFQQLPGKIKEFLDSAINNVTQWATNMANKAKEAATNFINNVKSSMQNLASTVKTYLDSAINNVTSWASDMASKATTAATNFINNVKNTITNLPSTIKSALDSAISNVTSWGTSLAQKGKEAINSLIQSVKDAASGIASQVASIGTNIVNGVWQGIQNAKNQFFSQVKSFFQGLVDGAKDALGIKSPSKVFANEVGRWLPPGVAEGFEDALPGAMKMIQRLMNKGVDNLEINDVEASATTFAHGLMDVYNQIAIWFESIEERLTRSVDNMTAQLVSLIGLGNQLVLADGTVISTGYAPTRRRSSPESDERSFGKTDTTNRTYVFYTSKSIDEIEAAKQMRRVERDIAEGF